MHALGFVLATLIGVSLGMLGGGGSILTVPVLVYAMGLAAKPAIAMSLPVVGITSLVGAVLHWRLGNVRLASAVAFGGFTMAGAYLGARAAAFVSGALQLVLLSAVMLLAAMFMMRPRREELASRRSSTRWLVVPIAIGVGVLTGLVGIGGGFLVVPALVLLEGVAMREAVGTSLVVIAMNSLSGFAGYLGRVEIDWMFLAAFTAMAVAGMIVGIALARRVPQAALRRGFALLLIAAGAFMFYKNRSFLMPSSASAALTPTPAPR